MSLRPHYPRGSTMLTAQQFEASISDEAPPVDTTIALRALWYDAKGQPESADRAASADNAHATLRVRAYLARKRGDADDARRWYWYAGLQPWNGPPETEWRDIVASICIERLVESAYV